MAGPGAFERGKPIGGAVVGDCKLGGAACPECVELLQPDSVDSATGAEPHGARVIQQDGIDVAWQPGGSCKAEETLPVPACQTLSVGADPQRACGVGGQRGEVTAGRSIGGGEVRDLAVCNFAVRDLAFRDLAFMEAR